MPLYFQSVRQASPIRSGVLMLPYMLSQTVMGVMAGVLIHKTGRYLELMWIGMALMTIGFGLFIHLDVVSPLSEVVGFQFVAGLGSGLVFEPPLIAIQAFVSQRDTAAATATCGFVLGLATSISVVVGGVLFQNGMQLQEPKLRAAGLSATITDQFSGRDAAANVMLIGNITETSSKLAVKGAYAWSLRNMWILYTCVSFLGLIATAFIEKRELSKEHVETKTGIQETQSSDLYA